MKLEKTEEELELSSPLESLRPSFSPHPTELVATRWGAWTSSLIQQYRSTPSFPYWGGVSGDYTESSNKTPLLLPDRVISVEALWGARIPSFTRQVWGTPPLLGSQHKLRGRSLLLPLPASNSVPPPFTCWSSITEIQLRQKI